MSHFSIARYPDAKPRRPVIPTSKGLSCSMCCLPRRACTIGAWSRSASATTSSWAPATPAPARRTAWRRTTTPASAAVRSPIPNRSRHISRILTLRARADSGCTNQLYDEYDEAEAAAIELEMELEDPEILAEAEASRARADNDRLRAENARLASNAAAGDERDAARAESERLRTEGDRLRAEVTRLSASADAAAVDALRRDNASLRSEIAELETNLRDSNSERDELAGSIRSIKLDAALKSHRKTRAEAQLRNREARLEQAHDALNAVTAERDRFGAEMASLIAERDAYVPQCSNRC